MTVVEVKPAEQAAYCMGNAAAIRDSADQIAVTLLPGLPADYVQKAEDIVAAGITAMHAAADHHSRAAHAALDIGQGDLESGEKIAAL